jgi:hypothetical protein
MNSKGRLLKGASAIAIHVFEDETKQRAIYAPAEQLGLFAWAASSPDIQAPSMQADK